LWQTIFMLSQFQFCNNMFAERVREKNMFLWFSSTFKSVSHNNNRHEIVVPLEILWEIIPRFIVLISRKRKVKESSRFSHNNARDYSQIQIVSSNCNFLISIARMHIANICLFHCICQIRFHILSMIVSFCVSKLAIVEHVSAFLG
jgi:hypothetical protein